MATDQDVGGGYAGDVEKRPKPEMDVWTEAWNWSWRWAKRLHAEAPSELEDKESHRQHQMARIATDEVTSTFPEHLRAYAIDPVDMVRSSIGHYCDAMDKTYS